ncbi:hypothetical protein D3C73_1352690 [compost metagenome]
MPMPPRISAREILVTDSLRPAHSTASNTPNSPTTTRRPNADCTGAAGAGAAAIAVAGADRELMGRQLQQQFYGWGKSKKVECLRKLTYRQLYIAYDAIRFSRRRTKRVYGSTLQQAFRICRNQRCAGSL